MRNDGHYSKEVGRHADYLDSRRNPGGLRHYHVLGDSAPEPIGAASSLHMYNLGATEEVNPLSLMERSWIWYREPAIYFRARLKALW